ncbi:ABC transporter permease, partial [Rubrivirga sp.]|uniref:ABC transporter permease n=1 Tax=Rubrivirga sp. TaxID=1885344 RepID=UPI003C78B308
MLKNYLLVALRSLRRQKGYAALNVVGLAIGLTCCLLLFQYVAHERSFDRFHENADSIYRATLDLEDEGSDPRTVALNGSGLAAVLEDGVPEIVQTARAHNVWKAVVSDPERPAQAFEVEDAFWVDPAFLQMFSFPLASGDAATALTEPGTVVLSREMAETTFGSADVVGRVLDVLAFGTRFESRVVGVLEDVPATSHLRFDVLLPMADVLGTPQYATGDGWGFSNFYTYVQLRDGAEHGVASAKAAAAFEQVRGDAFRESGTQAMLGLQPLADVHLNDAVEAPDAVAGSYRTVSFFTLLGLATLVIALVNYVNLATARAAGRAREVGVRKAVGAQRGQLVTQFLTESALTNVVALVLALGLAAVLRPTVNALVGAELSTALWTSPWLWGTFALTFVAATVLAGLYPAFVLSSFRPVTALRGRLGDSGGQSGLRRGLVVVQFAASVAMVAGVIVVSMQVSHMRDLDLGVNTEHVVVIPAPRVRPDGANRASDLDAFKSALAEIPSVLEVAASQTVPGQGHNMGTDGIRLDGSDQSVRGSITDVDADFAGLYDLTLVAGRAFDGLPAPLEGEPVPVLATASMVATLGFPDLEAALGAGVTLSGRDAEIVGVLEDAHWSSAHQAREDAFLAFN